jgi:carbamoyltransferase
MKILGINYLSESSVALIEDGELKYAISEERLNRVKNWWGNPIKSINFTLKETDNVLNDIDIFTTHGLSCIKNFIPDKSIFEKKIKEVLQSNLNPKKKKTQINFLKERFEHETKARKRNLNNISLLKRKYKKLDLHDHHEAHAASAYFYSGWHKCYVLTIDGWGDDASSKLYKANNGKLTQISSTSSIDSLGYFYGSITNLLGYKPHRHEGKILGLAAFGDHKKAYSYISKMISYDKLNKCFKGNFEKGLYLSKFDNPNIKFLNKKFSPEDIAAATQKRIEEVIIEFIKDNIKDNTKIALAGGVFSNVKINQKISELKNIKGIFIYPNMGDGGLAVGCAILSYNKSKKFLPRGAESMYLGPKFSNSRVLKVIKKNKLKFLKIVNPHKFIAKKLHMGYVVACFQGRMEFGPRSLGNRSILVNACDKTVNDWLNKKLERTEFMPFAPITLKKYADKMYKDLGNKKIATKFMTVTTRCTKEAKKKSPAAVHIDNTARPQIITKEDNKKIFDVLNEYFKISKIPNLINTSFNVHEEPIVCTPDDAVRAFKTSKLDFLYIEDYIVYR